MKPEVDISIVVPLLNEAESLPELTEWIAKVMKENNFSYEVLLVDDGSTDDSWEVITSLSDNNIAVKGIQFNRNYGKSAALNTGFKKTRGSVVITMDADLQDSPDEIPDLYKMIVTDGYDLVSGWKKQRHDPLSKTIPTKLFNGVTRKFSGIKLNDFNCGLKAYSYKVVKNITVYGEMHRYIPVIAKWAGFSNIGEKVVEHRARKYGTTKFGLERFINGLLDLMSIMFVGKFRKRPMHFFGSLGVLSMLFGFFAVCWIIGEKLFNLYQGALVEREVVDQPLFYIALVTIIIGVQFFMAGFLGELVSLNQSKKNEYIIAEQINL